VATFRQLRNSNDLVLANGEHLNRLP